MFSRLVGHLGHNVVAYVALFFALGGTAVAAKPLITGDQIQDNSLTGADVLESSLGTVPDADKLDNQDSTAFLSGLERVTTDKFAAGPGSTHMEHFTECPTGKRAVGGGITALLMDDEGFSTGAPAKVAVARTEIDAYFTVVEFDTEAPAGYRHKLQVTVVCVSGG